MAGPVKPAAAYFCKHPLEQMTDDNAWDALEQFIRAGSLAS
jgi:myo-inositol-1-phosphate synthase